MLDSYLAVIQAGGKGTRLRKLTHDKIPKPLLKINGKPMLEWQIENLVKYGICEIIIIVGHLGEKIEEYFGEGTKWNIKISYIRERKPLGSAGALYYLRNMRRKDFILIFGDIMFDIDWNRFINFHEKKGGEVTLLVHPNSHPFDSDLVIMDEENRITSFDYKGNIRNYLYNNCVNAGVYILKSNVLDVFHEEQYCDLEKDVLLSFIQKKTVYGYKTPEYVKDSGTIERFIQISNEQQRGIWNSKNLGNFQRCIFLDRDGTINKYKGFVGELEEFELEDNAAEAIRMINSSDYLAIVVTNQSVVARGICDITEVENMHKKMEILLGEKGAYLDDIIFCPHHPDKGYPEENADYKIKCKCRKPLTGMIDRMIEKYNISKEQSYIVGDTTTDIQLGKNAGIKTVLVHTGQSGKDGKYHVCADVEADDILDAVRKIVIED